MFIFLFELKLQTYSKNKKADGQSSPARYKFIINKLSVYFLFSINFKFFSASFL